jgi:hypothetical protein
VLITCNHLCIVSYCNYVASCCTIKHKHTISNFKFKDFWRYDAKLIQMILAYWHPQKWCSIFSIASLQKVHNAVSDSWHFIKRWFVKIINGNYKLCLGKEVSEEEWENIYSSTFYLLNDTPLQRFQFKINHRIIFTNHLLMKCQLSETALCTFCNDAIEKNWRLKLSII